MRTWRAIRVYVYMCSAFVLLWMGLTAGYYFQSRGTSKAQYLGQLGVLYFLIIAAPALWWTQRNVLSIRHLLRSSTPLEGQIRSMSWLWRTTVVLVEFEIDGRPRQARFNVWWKPARTIDRKKLQLLLPQEVIRSGLVGLEDSAGVIFLGKILPPGRHSPHWPV